MTHPFPSDTLLPPVITASLLSTQLRENPAIRLLDVRTPAEFQTAHIPGSYNVPLDTLGEHAPEIRGVSGTPIVVVCQSGQRARKADATLRGLGMSNLHVLDGGVNAWTSSGLDVVRGAARMSLERQVRIAAGAMAAIGGGLALFVDPRFAVIPAFVGSGLVFAGLTDTCAMGMLISRLPFNRVAPCDVGAVARALSTGATPTRASADGRTSASTASCAS